MKHSQLFQAIHLACSAVGLIACLGVAITSLAILNRHNFSKEFSGNRFQYLDREYFDQYLNRCLDQEHAEFIKLEYLFQECLSEYPDDQIRKFVNGVPERDQWEGIEKAEDK